RYARRRGREEAWYVCDRGHTARGESNCQSIAGAPMDEAVRQRWAARTPDFRQFWDDPDTANRERKRLLAYIIEDATLIKIPAEGITKIHVRFKGGRTKTLDTRNPKSSAQQIKTQPEVVHLVDQLLDHHVYSEIATILNERGFRPGASARPGRAADRFSVK